MKSITEQGVGLYLACGYAFGVVPGGGHLLGSASLLKLLKLIRFCGFWGWVGRLGWWIFFGLTGAGSKLAC